MLDLGNWTSGLQQVLPICDLESAFCECAFWEPTVSFVCLVWFGFFLPIFILVGLVGVCFMLVWRLIYLPF